MERFPAAAVEGFSQRLSTLRITPKVAYGDAVEVTPGGYGDCFDKSCTYGADHTIRTRRNVVYACRDHIGVAVAYASGNPYA